VTVVEFLLARIAEHEAVALAANTDEARLPWSDPNLTPVPPEKWGDLVDGYLGGEIGVHCAVWTPARVLAEAAAKRAILAEIERVLPVSIDPMTPAGVVALAMAQPFADHPDFDPAWRESVA
jgi:hypothetical protein